MKFFIGALLAASASSQNLYLSSDSELESEWSKISAAVLQAPDASIGE